MEGTGETPIPPNFGGENPPAIEREIVLDEAACWQGKFAPPGGILGLSVPRGHNAQMLRGFRHTLFALLQLGALLSGIVAIWFYPYNWQPIAIVVGGVVATAFICERLASRYLRNTVGKLRRAADDIADDRRVEPIDTQPGDDFYKLIAAINHIFERLEEAKERERELAEQLRQRERLAVLGELAASVAHEINNPLDGVQNCARILRRTGLDDPQRANHMIDLIEGGLERIHLIVRRLLTLAREHVIRPAPTRISGVVADAMAVIEPTVQSQPITITLHDASLDDWAKVDPPLLTQVFVNLLQNAVDSCDGRGAIDVRVDLEPPGQRQAMVRVEVRDNGAGIPADVLPNIFEPFYTTKHGGRGTGLGLAIASRIIDAHGGSLDVESEPGMGAAFFVRLPACSERSSIAAPHAAFRD